jgi:hypothetical protein
MRRSRVTSYRICRSLGVLPRSGSNPGVRHGHLDLLTVAGRSSRRTTSLATKSPISLETTACAGGSVHHDKLNCPGALLAYHVVLAVQAFARTNRAGSRARVARPGPLRCDVKAGSRRQFACDKLEPLMKSTIGRPRRLTDEQVTRILAWHVQILALKALRASLKTQKQIAAELNVAPATIARVIACRGRYKKPSP